jgi:hypothetical protein
LSVSKSIKSLGKIKFDSEALIIKTLKNKGQKSESGTLRINREFSLLRGESLEWDLDV